MEHNDDPIKTTNITGFLNSETGFNFINDFIMEFKIICRVMNV